MEGKHKELTEHDARLSQMIKNIVELEINNKIKQSYEDNGLTTTELSEFSEKEEEIKTMEP